MFATLWLGAALAATMDEPAHTFQGSSSAMQRTRPSGGRPAGVQLSLYAPFDPNLLTYYRCNSLLAISLVHLHLRSTATSMRIILLAYVI